MSTAKLNPCPFCQGAARQIAHEDDGTFDIGCDTHGCFMEHGAGWHMPIEAIVELWNLRHEEIEE